jgi:hypothetical protein
MRHDALAPAQELSANLKLSSLLKRTDISAARPMKPVASYGTQHAIAFCCQLPLLFNDDSSRGTQ